MQTHSLTLHFCYLEVKDASVVVTEALVGGNDSSHHILVEGQRGDGCQQPTVAWTDRKTIKTDSLLPPTGCKQYPDDLSFLIV